LVFKGRHSSGRDLVWVDRQGRAEPIVGAPRRDYDRVSLSPDGTRIASATTGDSSEIFVWDTRRAVETQVTTDAATHVDPVWLPDGQQLLFATIQENASTWYRRRVDLATPSEIVRKFQTVAYPLAIAADAKTVLVAVEPVGATRYLARLSLSDSASQPVPLIGTDGTQTSPALSPDGRWIAYRGIVEPGNVQVFVRPFPDATAGQFQVSQGGAMSPLWSPTGKELFFVGGQLGEAKETLMDAAVSTTPTFEIGTPQAMFDVKPYVFGADRRFDVAPDGQHFLMLAAPPGGDVQSYTIVTHWFDELAARVK
jgi:Tol biopolymer transport system component